MYLFHLKHIQFGTNIKTTEKGYTTNCTNPFPWTNSTPVL